MVELGASGLELRAKTKLSQGESLFLIGGDDLSGSKRPVAGAVTCLVHVGESTLARDVASLDEAPSHKFAIKAVHHGGHLVDN